MASINEERLWRQYPVRSVKRTAPFLGGSATLGVGFQTPPYLTGDACDCMEQGKTVTIILVLSGRTRYIAADGSATDARAGTLIHRLPGIWHETRVETRETYAECWLFLPLELHEMVCRTFGLMTCPAVMSATFLPAFVAHYKALADLIASCPEPQLPRVFSAAQMLTTELYLHALRPPEPGTDAVMNEACRRLSERLDERFEIAQLVADLPLSYERFRKLFRQRMGISPGEYRLHRRLERAAEWLESSETPVKQIAFLLGYRDSAAFCNQFQSFIGCSPSAFRAGPRHPITESFRKEDPLKEGSKAGKKGKLTSTRAALDRRRTPQK